MANASPSASRRSSPISPRSALIGFILPSLALCVLLPAAVGFRRWGLAATVGVVCVVSILLIFVYALGRPIPEDLLSPLLAKLR